MGRFLNHRQFSPAVPKSSAFSGSLALPTSSESSESIESPSVAVPLQSVDESSSIGMSAPRRVRESVSRKMDSRNGLKPNAFLQVDSGISNPNQAIPPGKRYDSEGRK
jgi:hypothetical protein